MYTQVEIRVLAWFYVQFCYVTAPHIQGNPKKVSHSQMIKNRIKSYLRLLTRLDLFIKLKYESSVIILFVGIRYSMRDLLSDLSNYA